MHKIHSKETSSVTQLLSLVSTTRVDGPSWRVTSFHYPSVNSASGNRALVKTFCELATKGPGNITLTRHNCFMGHFKLKIIPTATQNQQFLFVFWHCTQISKVLEELLIIWLNLGVSIGHPWSNSNLGWWDTKSDTLGSLPMLHTSITFSQKFIKTPFI